MREITVGIDGMMCEMCESHIQNAIRDHFHVNKVKANRKKNNAVIVAEDDISEDALHEVIDPTGYKITSYETKEYKKKGLFGF